MQKSEGSRERAVRRQGRMGRGRDCEWGMGSLQRWYRTALKQKKIGFSEKLKMTFMACKASKASVEMEKDGTVVLLRISPVPIRIGLKDLIF